MRRVHGARRRCIAALLVAALLRPADAAAQSCVGDCPPPNVQVAVNELILGVNIALGSAALDACPLVRRERQRRGRRRGAGHRGQQRAERLRRRATPTHADQRRRRPSTPATPTATWTPAPGPSITFFGVTNADDSLQARPATARRASRSTQRPFGFGFKLVVEADGTSGSASRRRMQPGGHARPADPGDARRSATAAPRCATSSRRPSAACPASIRRSSRTPTPSPTRSTTSAAGSSTDAGNRVGRSCAEACVRYEDGEFHCMDEETQRPVLRAGRHADGVPGRRYAGDRPRARRVRRSSARRQQMIIRVTARRVSGACRAARTRRCRVPTSRRGSACARWPGRRSGAAGAGRRAPAGDRSRAGRPRGTGAAS